MIMEIRGNMLAQLFHPLAVLWRDNDSGQEFLPSYSSLWLSPLNFLEHVSHFPLKSILEI